MMGVVFNDTFTEAADTALTAHTPETGTGWSQEIASSGGAIAEVVGGAGRAAADIVSNSDDMLYSAAPGPSNAEYDVEIDTTGTNVPGTDDMFWMVGRFVDTNNFYTAGRRPSTGCYIFKRVSGATTQLASAGGGSENPKKFEIRNAAKKYFSAGVERISTTDNAITQAGKAGMAWGDTNVAGDDIHTNWWIQYFTVTEVEAAAGAAGQLMLLGCGT